MKVIKKIQSVKSGAGFTLIEVLIYIALFTVLMISILGVTFQTLAATNQINKKIILEQESNFILRKFDWALNDASNIPVPDTSGDSLVINRFNNPAQVKFALDNNFLQIDEGFGFNRLNSSNILVSNLVFTKTLTPGQPIKLEAGFTLSFLNDPLNTENFGLSRYLK